MSVLEILVNKNLIRPNDVLNIKEEMEKSGGSLDAILKKRGVTGEDVLQAKAEYFGIPSRNLDNYSAPFEILKYVPEESAVYINSRPSL